MLPLTKNGTPEVLKAEGHKKENVVITVGHNNKI